MRAVDMLQKTTRMCGGHYETGLLWCNEELKLPNNRSQAERRLDSLKRKFSCDPGLEDKYRAVIDDNFAKGHARKMSAAEAAKKGPKNLVRTTLCCYQ